MRRLATITVLLLLSTPATASASCVLMAAKQQKAQADVIFDGVALENPTRSGVQRFRVVRYLKGSGSDEVSVATGVTRNPDGSGTTTSVSVEAAKGESWRVFAQHGARGVLTTNVCMGSKRIADLRAADGRSATDDPEPAGGGRSELGTAALVAGLALLGGALALLARRRFGRRPA